MNDKVLHIVEFNKIIEKLTENANSAPAKALCRDLRPMDNLADIRLAQEETDAALQLLIRKGNVNFGSNRAGIRHNGVRRKRRFRSWEQ